MRSEHGAVLDASGTQVASTHQCPHCSGHFVMRRGSGTRRGWCTACLAVTCGSEECDVCVPVEEKLNYLSGEKVLPKYEARLRELPLILGT